MGQLLPDGIPSIRDYDAVLESDLFKAMEQYSNRFLLDNKIVLKKYARKWVADPLHQWSRQWEYPFVYGKVQQMAKHEPQLRILDAGSGLTFFSYFLSEQFNQASVHCCDYDKALLESYRKINEGKRKTVEFSPADLRDLSYEPASFDMIYCISVLEHTDDYEKIIDNFYNILKPGGILVVTFDVSLDRTRRIDVDQATVLLNSLTNRFDKNSAVSTNVPADVLKPGIFTTRSAQALDPELLPWQAPAVLYHIYSFLTTRRFGLWPPTLTVFCLSLMKGATETFA